MPESRTIRKLEERMAGMEPGSLRREALEAAKRFKAIPLARKAQAPRPP